MSYPKFLRQKLSPLGIACIAGFWCFGNELSASESSESTVVSWFESEESEQVSARRPEWLPYESNRPAIDSSVTKWQKSNVTGSASEPASRSELESVQHELAALQQEFDNIQQSSAHGYSGPHQNGMLHKEPAPYFLSRYTSSRVPGWDRARGADWMDLGRRQRMTTLIGQSGDMNLYMGLNTVGRFQYLQQRNAFDSIGPSSVVPGPLEPGLQTPYGQIVFLADFHQAIEVYFDIYIASRPHEDLMQGDEGFMLFRQLPGPLGENQFVSNFFEVANLKVGEFEVDYGDAHYRRSNNADVQRNPLIGNYVMDPRGTDTGFEIFSAKGSSLINWLVGVGTGTTGDFQANRGWQTHAKLWAETDSGFRPSISIFHADHSGNPTGYPNTGSKEDIFSSSRSGGPYADVLGAGDNPGSIVPGKGQRVTAGQFDLSWTESPLELYGHFGAVQDADINGSAGGSPTESWLYYAGESVYRFNQRAYVAARYSGAAASRLVSSADPARDVPSDGFVDRFQVGGGYWAHDLILVKLEYVHQSYRGFDANGSQVSGVDAFRNPTFDGVMMEVSFTF